MQNYTYRLERLTWLTERYRPGESRLESRRFGSISVSCIGPKGGLSPVLNRVSLSHYRRALYFLKWELLCHVPADVECGFIIISALDMNMKKPSWALYTSRAGAIFVFLCAH